MNVKRKYSNKLLSFKKEGEVFDEISPRVFSSFNERYLKKFFEGKDNKYLKKHWSCVNLTFKDDSFFYGGLDFLKQICDEKLVYGGLLLSYLFETKIVDFANILNRLKSSDPHFDDELLIHSKKLEWTMLSYTTYDPVNEDSLCIVGEEQVILKFREQAEKFKVLHESKDYQIDVYSELIKQFPNCSLA